MNNQDQTQPDVMVTVACSHDTANDFSDPPLEIMALDRDQSGSKKTRAQDQWTWSGFRLWRKQRPFWGAILLLLAGLLVLWGPVSCLRFATLPGSTLWAGLLVGGLLFVMGLIQLFLPSNASMAGAVGIILSLVSLLVALGGLGVGVLLGLMGSALGVAWKPTSGTTNRLFFWPVFGLSLLILTGMIAMISQGMLAIAAPISPPLTQHVDTIVCYNNRQFLGISHADHKTPVIVNQSEYCTALHLVTIARVMGVTVKLTAVKAVFKGAITETIASYADLQTLENGVLTSSGGFETFSSKFVLTNATSLVVFQYAVSQTFSGSSISLS